MQLAKLIEILRELAPESLAEQWDRVGLHVGRMRQRVRTGLLCIDLTEPVVAEAKRLKADLVVAYHPPIFRPLDELTDQRVKPRIVLELAQAGIAVYSPHTALDAAADGVNDWLAAGVGEGEVRPIRPTLEDEGVGAGRVVELARPVALGTLVQRVKKRLGLRQLEVASPPGPARRVRRVGLCVGAGGSLLAEMEPSPDAFITGEMRHHDVLAAAAESTAVILAGHTQTERPYLPTYRRRLQTATGKRIDWRVSHADKAPSTLR